MIRALKKMVANVAAKKTVKAAVKSAAKASPKPVTKASGKALQKTVSKTAAKPVFKSALKKPSKALIQPVVKKAASKTLQSPTKKALNTPAKGMTKASVKPNSKAVVKVKQVLAKSAPQSKKKITIQATVEASVKSSVKSKTKVDTRLSPKVITKTNTKVTANKAADKTKASSAVSKPELKPISISKSVTQVASKSASKTIIKTVQKPPLTTPQLLGTKQPQAASVKVTSPMPATIKTDATNLIPVVSTPQLSPAATKARTSRLAQLTVPSMAQAVASTAAKASYGPATATQFFVPAQQFVAKHNPKLANNWKNKAPEALTDEEVLAMPAGEYMNAKQFAFFRLKLVALKNGILESAGATTEHLRDESAVVPDPTDRATIEEEHALELRTRDRERKLLKKIEQAIARIDSGDYGYCDETGEAIGVGRLLARPTATLSLEAQQRRELKQKMFGD